MRTSTTNEIKWCPPQPGSYKVNIDDVVFSKQKQAGIEVVIRDSTGEVVAALSLVHLLGELEIEAKALEAGV